MDEQAAVATGMDEREVKAWQARIEACRKARKKLIEGPWRDNVAYRVQRPFREESEEDRVAVPQDWSRTRAKTAQLFSAVPTVTLSAQHPKYAAAVPVFQKEFTHVLTYQAKPEVVMEECLADLVNATGICAGIVQYEATFQAKEVPAIDLSMVPPEQAAQLLAMKQVPMTTVDTAVSEQFRMRRISAAHLIWDTAFTGSDWNDARFVGYDGTLPWAAAKREFKLNDVDKERVLRAERQDSLAPDDHTSDDTDKFVRFTMLFSRPALFDPDELHLEKIRRTVFVEGIEDRPVIYEDYKGQRFNDQVGKYVGVYGLYPLQICVLDYVSDHLIPPSSSEIGRPMVLEQIRSRSQMLMQRESSLPQRWFDTNRLDPTVAALIQRGEWQGYIPTQGEGSRVIGEVSRAAYPPQNFQFDQIINKDLDDAWGLSQNQMGTYQTGERSASESNIVAGANATISGKDRAKVVKFFLNLCEVLGGLMQLYYTPQDAADVIGEDGAQRLASWDQVTTAGKFVYSIRQDSTVLLTSEQRINQLMKTLNLVGKSGFVNAEPIIAEIVALSGLDPATVMTKPQPPAPEMPNISLRLSSLADLLNPVSIALLIKSGQAPGPQEIAAAKKLLEDVGGAPPVPEPGMNAPNEGMAPPAANPDWAAMERVTKRPDELGG